MFKKTNRRTRVDDSSVGVVPNAAGSSHTWDSGALGGVSAGKLAVFKWLGAAKGKRASGGSGMGKKSGALDTGIAPSSSGIAAGTIPAGPRNVNVNRRSVRVSPQEASSFATFHQSEAMMGGDSWMHSPQLNRRVTTVGGGSMIMTSQEPNRALLPDVRRFLASHDIHLSRPKGSSRQLGGKEEPLPVEKACVAILQHIGCLVKYLSEALIVIPLPLHEAVRERLAERGPRMSKTPSVPTVLEDSPRAHDGGGDSVGDAVGDGTGGGARVRLSSDDSEESEHGGKTEEELVLNQDDRERDVFRTFLMFTAGDWKAGCSCYTDNQTCRVPLRVGRSHQLVAVVDPGWTPEGERKGKCGAPAYLFCSKHAKHVLGTRRLSFFHASRKSKTAEAEKAKTSLSEDNFSDMFPFPRAALDRLAVVRFPGMRRIIAEIDLIREIRDMMPSGIRLVVNDLEERMVNFCLEDPTLLEALMSGQYEGSGDRLQDFDDPLQMLRSANVPVGNRGNAAVAQRALRGQESQSNRSSQRFSIRKISMPRLPFRGSRLAPTKQSDGAAVASSSGPASPKTAGSYIAKGLINRDRPRISSSKMMNQVAGNVSGSAASSLGSFVKATKAAATASAHLKGAQGTVEYHRNTMMRRKGVTAAQAFDAIQERERLPMRVVPFGRLLALGRLPRSDDGETRPINENDIIVFVSHRWWGGMLPDIHGLKYGLVCRGIHALALQRGYDLEHVVLWLDYACIDQDDTENMALGIASLISYAATCHAMLVPIFPNKDAVTNFCKATHPSELLDYGERAWCRLENYVAMCISEIRGVQLPLFAYGLRKVFGTKAIPEKAQLEGVHRSLSCLPPRSVEMLKELGGDMHQAGAFFSNEDLPRNGQLSVESDRSMVIEVENDVREVYVTFAIRAELRRLVQETEDEMEIADTHQKHGFNLTNRFRRAHHHNHSDRTTSSSFSNKRSPIFMVSLNMITGSKVPEDVRKKSYRHTHFAPGVHGVFLRGKQLDDSDVILLAGLFEDTVLTEARTSHLFMPPQPESAVATNDDVKGNGQAKGSPKLGMLAKPASPKLAKSLRMNFPGSDEKGTTPKQGENPPCLGPDVSDDVPEQKQSPKASKLGRVLGSMLAKRIVANIRPFVQVLDLQTNSITQRGVTFLKTALMQKGWCRNLKLLDLSGNILLGDKGVEAVTRALDSSEIRVTELGLANTGLSTAGGLSLIDWLSSSTTASEDLDLIDLCRHQFDDKFGAKVLEYHNTVKVKYDEAEALHTRQVQKMQSKHAKDYLEDAFGLDAGTSPPRSSSTLESKAGLHGGSGRLARCKRILFDKGDMTFGVWHAALVPFDS